MTDQTPTARADGKPFRGYHAQTLDYGTFYISDRTGDQPSQDSVDLMSVTIDSHGRAPDTFDLAILEPATIGLPCVAGLMVRGFTTRDDAERAAAALLMVTDWTRTA